MQIMNSLSMREDQKNIDYLRPDAKAQVTVKYSENHKIIGVDSIVISTQHDDFIVDDEKLLNKLRHDITELVKKFLINDYDSNIPDLFSQTKFLINPAGKFVIGGPHGDTGLTGRKIIVDSYGGKGAHGVVHSQEKILQKLTDLLPTWLDMLQKIL